MRLLKAPWVIFIVCFVFWTCREKKGEFRFSTTLEEETAGGPEKKGNK